MEVHSVQQKSIGQKFSKSRTGSDVRYSCVEFICLSYIKNTPIVGFEPTYFVYDGYC